MKWFKLSKNSRNQKLLDNGEDFLNLIKKESDDGVNDGHLGTFEKAEWFHLLRKLLLL